VHVSAQALSHEPRPEALFQTTSCWPKLPALRNKPSIAVLPFTNFGDDCEMDYFAEGVVEDIITVLTHVPRLEVIARRSSSEGRAADSRLRQELGVRYILQGSVRRAGDRLRVIGRLIDAQNGTHLWAEQFDHRLENIVDLQDHVTRWAVGAIAPCIEAAEIERAQRNRRANRDPYGLYLRALAAVRKMTHAGSDEALSLVDRILEINPDYVVAAGLGAWACTLRVAQNWPVDHEAAGRRGVELGRVAVHKGGDDAEALAAGGYALAALGGELHEGLRAIERAISLSPNSATALSHAGWVYDYLGQPHRAVEALQRPLRSSPRDPTLFRTYTALTYAHVLLGEFDQALLRAVRPFEVIPITPSATERLLRP
jgi:TolB-like protein